MMVEHNQSANVQSGVGYDNKFKFNGKELDDFTQMYYYGARYYDPRISIFVSVDPLAEQFAGWTPYHYVHQNPINLIDPTGMSAEWSDGPPDPPKKTKKDAENQGTENVVTKYFNTAVAIVTDPVGTAINTLSGVGKLANEMITNKEDVGSFILRKANEAYDSYLYRIKYSQDPEYEFHVVMAELKTEISLMIASEGAAALAGETLNGIRALRAVKAIKPAKTSMTTVGRWMSKAEYEMMAKTGYMVEGAGGQTFVATGGPGAFNAAAKGSVYAEFQVPTNSLLQGGQANWFKVIGPNAGKAMKGALQKQGGQFLPKVQNLSPILQTK